MSFDPKAAKEKLDKAIQTGVAQASTTVQRVLSTVPEDAIVRTRSLAWEPRERDVAIVFNGQAHPIHEHAMRQIGEVAGIPRAYVESLMTEGTPQQRRALLAHNLREMMAEQPETKRHLVRTVGNSVRGFLSDSYRRLDSRPLLSAFVEEVDRFGAVPYSGRAGDVRSTLKAIIPRVLIAGGDAVAFGLQWENSDFGAGAHSIRAFLLRLTCLNGATTEDNLRQVHLGKRLEESIEFSAKTLALDTQANVSALRDVVKAALLPAKIDSLIARIDAAQAKEVNWGGLKTRLAKALNKGEMTAAETAFLGPDVENLPPAPTLWRASNALSWIAKTATPDRALELEKLAGGILENKIVAEAA
jgi:hypothetical protein